MEERRRLVGALGSLAESVQVMLDEQGHACPTESRCQVCLDLASADHALINSDIEAGNMGRPTPPVGMRRRRGVEYGCGEACGDCYEVLP